MKLTLFCLSITELSQIPISTDFRPSNASFATSIFIPLALMCPSLLCHRHEPEAPSATTAMIWRQVCYTPCSGVQGSRFGATSYYQSTFHNLPRTFPKLCCISRAIQLTNRDQIFLDPRNISDILQCPLVSRGGLYANIPFPSIAKALLSERYTFLKFPDLKFWNNSLLGDEWK